jgi:hypothetical protein
MKYICKKDYVMLNTKKVAFKKGNIYDFDSGYKTKRNEWGGTHNLNAEVEFYQYFELIESETKTPSHYDNTNGSLYLFAEQHKLNAWEFDIIKRIVRCRKKGNFIEDLHKTIEVIKLYENETTTNNSRPTI